MKHVTQLQTLAVAAIRDLLTNPDTPPSVRLRAATIVLDSKLTETEATPDPTPIPAPDPLNAPEPTPAPNPEPLHASSPQQPYLAPPTPGRNEPCSCGSGVKYKKCCLLKRAFAATP